MSSNEGSSGTHGSMRDAVRGTMKDAEEAARESAKAASETANNIEADVDSLRTEIKRLAEQITDIVTVKGSEAWNRVVSDATATGEEAVRKVRHSMVETIDDSLKERPYTTLAIAAAIGFLFGATWRR